MTLTCGLHPFCLPLLAPIKTTNTVISHREGILVSLTDNASGHTGWGEASPLPGWSRTGIAQTSEALICAQRQINAETSARAHTGVIYTGVSQDTPAGVVAAEVSEDISKGIYDKIKSLSCTPHARAGLAGAWMDLQARKSSQPLMSYLTTDISPATTNTANTNTATTNTAARHPDTAIKHTAARHTATTRHSRVDAPVAVRVNALLSCVEPETIQQRSYEIAQAGFTALKLKVGFVEPSLDVLRVQAARAGAGADMELRIDANRAWDTTTAIETLERVSSQHVAFCEEPVRGLRALASVAQASDVPIAADESIQSADDVESAIEAGVRVVVVKPQAIGGADIALMIAHHAQLAGAAVVVTSFLDTYVGVAHALHTAAAVDALRTLYNPPWNALGVTPLAHNHPTLLHNHPTQAHGLATGSLLENSFLHTVSTVHTASNTDTTSTFQEERGYIHADIHAKRGYIHIPQTHGIGFTPRIHTTDSRD